MTKRNERVPPPPRADGWTLRFADTFVYTARATVIPQAALSPRLPRDIAVRDADALPTRVPVPRAGMSGALVESLEVDELHVRSLPRRGLKIASEPRPAEQQQFRPGHVRTSRKLAPQPIKPV